ncbi:MAG: hemin uptake protein HemP [Neomegalonema sp.]|nr:hemin uptake protein HemP [Neomegalonema sp.]
MEVSAQHYRPKFKAPARQQQPSLKQPTRTQEREVDIRDLLGSNRIVTICHGDQRYTLRLTRQNKLILTK